MKLILITILFFYINTTAQEYYFTLENQNIPLSATTINSMDVESADVDNDGDLDIIVAGEYRRNLLLFNDGNGVFTEDNTKLFPDKNLGDGFTGEDTEDIALVDFDLDGDLDVFFASEDTINHELLVNDGTGKFTFITYNFPPSLGEAIAVLDLNNDDYPDIIIGVNGQNRVYLNNQDLTFTEAPSRWPTNNEGTQDLKLVDLDNDNDLDIVEGIDSGTNNILINNNGFFTDESNRLPDTGETIETRKVTLGDINNDGFIDIFYSNVNFNNVANFQDRLFLNDGTGFFTDITDTNFPVLDFQSLDAVFIDYDFDGDLDLLSVGFLHPTQNYYFYQNDGSGVFTDVTNTIVAPFTMTDGIALHIADFNNDNYPDIYIGGFQQTDDLLFYNPDILAVNENNFSETNLIIYPTPATQKVNITVEVTQTFDSVSIEMYTILGQKIASIYRGDLQTGANNFQLDVSSYTAGIYFIKMMVGKNNISKKLIIKY